MVWMMKEASSTHWKHCQGKLCKQKDQKENCREYKGGVYVLKYIKSTYTASYTASYIASYTASLFLSLWSKWPFSLTWNMQTKV